MTAPSGFDVIDEYMHEPTDHPQFNESMYFNFVDGKSGFATLIRMGNRANEGHAEVTVLLYMPDGGAAFHFERADIKDNSAFNSAGLRFEIVEPFKRSRVTFGGNLRMMRHGTELEDPKKVFAENPLKRVAIAFDYEDVVPMFGLGGGDSRGSGIAGAEDSIATGHYQGPCRVSGTITIDGEVRTLAGLGYRDHSWGPRVWQGPAYWRWVCGIADEKNAFIGWLAKIGDKRPPDRGVVLRDGRLSYVERIELESSYGPKPHYPETMRMTLHTVDGSTHQVSGRSLNLVPLRNRRDGEVARLAELVCCYDFDGLTAYGISEYHDRMTDGVPAGMHEV